MTTENLACDVNWAMLLEYIKVCFSWPVITLVILFVLIRHFKAPIADFLSRVTKAEGLGGKLEAAPPQEQAKLAEDEQRAPEDVPVQWIREHPDQAWAEYQKAYNSFRWERAFNLIYGTQIDLLEALTKKGDVGILYVDLAVFHAEHQRRSGATNYQMTDYLLFLQTEGLISSFGAANDLKIKITPYGLSFLSYLKSVYPGMWNKRPY